MCVHIHVNSKLIRLSEMMVFSGLVVVCSTSLFFDLSPFFKCIANIECVCPSVLFFYACV